MKEVYKPVTLMKVPAGSVLSNVVIWVNNGINVRAELGDGSVLTAHDVPISAELDYEATAATIEYGEHTDVFFSSDAECAEFGCGGY